MKKITRICVLASVAFLSLPGGLEAGSSPVPAAGTGTVDDPAADDPMVGDPVEVVILGVSHFAGSAGDDHTFAIDDILEPHRQAELEEAAALLAAFGPDEAYLECTPEREGEVDGRYRSYRSGELDPVEEGHRGEIHQLGFRVASEAGLEEVRCADAEGLWLGDQARAVGAEHQPDVVEEIARAGEANIQRSVEFLQDHDMVEYLRFVNSEDELYENHRQYIERFVRIGTFGDSELSVRVDTELEGREVVLAGDFSGFPIHRVRNAFEPAGVVLADEVGPSTDYVVTGRSPGDAVEAGQEHGATVMGVQEFVAYAMEASDVFVGFPEGRIGADLVGEWYKRNLRTFANILDDVGPDTERVFIMIGAGHVWTLRQFFRDHSGFEVVPVDRVL